MALDSLERRAFASRLLAFSHEPSATNTHPALPSLNWPSHRGRVLIGPMVFYRRKKVLLENGPVNAPEVFYLAQTGEIFGNYEAYAARISFYRTKQFQCEVTGKSGLNYFQALDSEREEGKIMHGKFSESLKRPILNALQGQIMGRLDHLVEAVFERFKDRYFVDEKVLVDLSGVKYWATITKVYPPRFYNDEDSRNSHYHSGNLRGSVSHQPPLRDDETPHLVGGNLDLSLKDAAEKDDPDKYFYWVRVGEMEKEKSHEKKAVPAQGQNARDSGMSGSLMEVQVGIMARDRVSFSKSIMRRFIRDCVEREPSVSAPWLVKGPIARRYNIAPVLQPEPIVKEEPEKRKKQWDDTDGPPAKKKRLELVDDDYGDLKPSLAAKQEAERAAQKQKKKPPRYPTEDLDVRLGDREKRGGMKVQRPIPSKEAAPFNDVRGAFEDFIHAWNFLTVHGSPLRLSTITLDEFEQAMRHSGDETCVILAEIHSQLIYNLRTVMYFKHGAIRSMVEEMDADPDYQDVQLGITLAQLTTNLSDKGNNWERVALRPAEEREGWEDALLGCLKDHATVKTFPALRRVLTRLSFGPEEVPGVSPQPLFSDRHTLPSTPFEQYHSLPPEDRVAILAFLCNTAISSKAVHVHLDQCDEALTTLRKEKIEVNRQKKTCAESMGVFLAQAKASGEMLLPPVPVVVPPPAEDPESSELSEESDGEKFKGKKKAEHPRSGAKSKVPAPTPEQPKTPLSEYRRCEVETAKLDRRLEAIEREFRQLLGASRVKPLGRDRFYNRIWWFDGCGSGCLVDKDGGVLYGSGRVFVQGPSEFDVEILERRELEDDLPQRRLEEEGPNGTLGVGEWAVYSRPEQVEEFVAWLHSKGQREDALKKTMAKLWLPYIAPGMRKRLVDLQAQLPEAKRNTRATEQGGREGYMGWTNSYVASQ